MQMKEQFKTPLLDALKAYHKREVIPFDVPGHKHGKGIKELTEFFGEKIMQVDVNSMKPLDNISNPIGVIKEAEDLMAKAYGTDHAYFLVNGTTSAVQAMIMSVLNPNEKILMPRNAHKSAINALILSGAIPVYLQPEIDDNLGFAVSVSVEGIKEALDQNEDIKAVFLMNPTYYGTVSDLKEIVKICHDRDIPLLIDEAHGAHFKFHEDLPLSGAEIGADMVAVSLHKTGGALTQSSALLVNDGYLDKNRIRHIINLTQTTSASYLLMTSLDVCRKNLMVNGQEILTEVIELVEDARIRINKIDGLYAFGKEVIGKNSVIDFDVTKLGVNVTGIGLTGLKAYDILRDEYNIQVELGDMYNILAIVSLGDSKESLNALVEALEDMADKYRDRSKKVLKVSLKNPEVVVSPREAFYSKTVSLPIKDAIGKISGEAVMAYPPGIPIISQGERITQDTIQYIELLKSQESMLTGTKDPYVNNIEVLI
ncbi:aminotransferase class I/II-fold pyridoxal phosphate-dependent enzyme [Clostridium sp. D2Q-11]|uniref:Aminotransferase class I/II-fold pyridoxal phosphate-dependent enzyme n=1 Tax=Anaeromonas frigoriresistens TaxID=2683708 RepID=A0A942UXC4_9FIRM|nr:aminotransferase class I/II-fold pyridoxal phosphate-dependent enzyme [Anaeromonas frigoriresistens]MBS4538676.1 aminotransferase class I/II-fold pyridoxal phosphate-dependent enzyme [Anaeromonas frigoriresistens]